MRALPSGYIRVVCIAIADAGALGAGAEELGVISVEPAAHSVGAPVDDSIVVHFDRPVDRASFVPLRA